MCLILEACFIGIVTAMDIPVTTRVSMWLLQFLHGWLRTETCKLSEGRNFCTLFVFHFKPCSNQRSNYASLSAQFCIWTYKSSLVNTSVKAV